MKVIYSGYYGAKNSGDDAFVEIASWGAKKYWAATEHLFFSESLPSIRIAAKFYSPHSSYSNFLKSVIDIARSDIFVSAGGSTFHSELKITDLRTYAKLKKRFLLQGKTGAIGISLGPYRNKKSETSTIEYLKTLDFLALRDKKSFDIAKSYKLPYEPIHAFDLAALLPVMYSKKMPKLVIKNKIIGVSVCYYERYSGGDIIDEAKRNKFLVNLLLELKKNPDYIFRFFIFNGNRIYGDEELTVKIIDQLKITGGLKYEIIPYLASVEETYKKIAECDLVISTRLHASIFACYSNVPFFLLEYHRKCTDFLEDVGQHYKYRIYDGEANIFEVSKHIEDIIFNSVYLPPTFVEETKCRALKNFLKLD